MKYKKYIIITIIVLFITIISYSYAAFITKIVGSEEGTTLTSGSGIVEINYDGGPAINVPDIYPREEEFLTKEFTLTGKNTYNTKMEYHIILKMNTNTFRDGALAYTLTSVNNNNNGQTVQQIEYLNGIKTGEREVFLGNGFFEGISNASHTYTLKMYLPKIENFDHTVDQNKEFSAKIEIREGNIYPGYNEEKGVNHPVLFTGMTPVKWNENNEETETTEDDPDWYDYNEKRWANAKSADGSYWVWIPRYAYKIETCYHKSTEDCLALTGKEAGDINVHFLRSTTNLTKDKNLVETTGYLPGNKDTSMHYFLHPAFQINGDELGFWVAKYEASSHDLLKSGITNGSCNSEDNDSTKRPKIVPNATSWRCINNSDMYYASLAMRNNPIYGWLPTEVDTHLMTNLEWGAVAYLSKSKYGAHEEEVWNNAFTGFQTGCSGTEASAANEETCIAYETPNGQKASTTHNIYGVYDMSGGAWERVMGNYNGLGGYSGFSSEDVLQIPSHHITRYYTATEDLHNGTGVNYDLTVYGDAVYETSYNAYRHGTGSQTGAWYSDRTYFPFIPSKPWFARGAFFRDWTSAGGVFAFSFTDYPGTWPDSFRPSLFPL